MNTLKQQAEINELNQRFTKTDKKQKSLSNDRLWVLGN
jgi:hypothetical protein